MANKTWVGLLMVLIGLFLWFTHQPADKSDQTQQSHSKEAVTSNEPPTTAIDRIEELAETTELAPPTESPTSTEMSEWQQKVLQEIEARMFSDDPYVELYSLEFLVGQCREQDIVERLFVGKGVFFEAQQQLAKKLQQRCSELKNQYQEYLSFPEHEQLIRAFQPNSKMGRLLKQMDNPNLTTLDRRELSSAILQQAIKEQNSSSLMYSVFIVRFGSMINTPLAAVIDSNDQEYVNQMSSLALMLMACQYQGGKTCESTSFYMIIMCSQQPAACGLDFPSWYQKTTLPGMQRDVDKMITYFQQYGQ